MDIPIGIQVSVFLKEFKSIATEGRGLYVIDRKKNLLALIGLKLTQKNRKNEILSLSNENYCKGPKPDKDQKGDIWEFGKIINGEEVYIKLKIATIGNERIAKCISFHKAEYPLIFPLQKS